MRFVIFAAFLTLPTGVSAQAVSADNPPSVVAALQDFGYQAELGTDSRGDPKISSRIEGVRYTIYFYGCRDNRNCQDLQFSAGFDLNNGTTAANMNQWNRTKLVGKASVDDENDPFLRHFITGVSGMSRASFERTVDRWSIAMDGFKEHIDW